MLQARQLTAFKITGGPNDYALAYVYTNNTKYMLMIKNRRPVLFFLSLSCEENQLIRPITTCFTFHNTNRYSLNPTGAISSNAAHICIIIVTLHERHDVSDSRQLECLFETNFGITKNKGSIRGSYNRSFVRGNHRWSIDSPHELTVMRKVLIMALSSFIL